MNNVNMMGSGSITGPPARYGWLGAAQRSAEALGGVVLMGQRLYLPTIGRFLSVDPVAGGSANPYDYCQADPVNCTDLDGTFSLKKLAGVVAAVASIASMVPGPVGMAAAGVSVVAYAVAGDKKQALIAAAGIALAAAAVAISRAGIAAKAAESGVAAGRVVTGNRVFWSGGNIAKNAAADFARATGGRTLEMTATGKILERVSKVLPRRVTQPLWERASARFASSARGVAHVFLGPGDPAPKSVFSRIEAPILAKNGVRVVTHRVF